MQIATRLWLCARARRLPPLEFRDEESDRVVDFRIKALNLSGLTLRQPPSRLRRVHSHVAHATARVGHKRSRGNELDEVAVSYQVVFTKVDKIKPPARARLEETTLEVLARRPAAFPQVLATSSEKGTGISALRAEIAELAGFALLPPESKDYQFGQAFDALQKDVRSVLSELANNRLPGRGVHARTRLVRLEIDPETRPESMAIELHVSSRITTARRRSSCMPT